jgi:hypothetical protein
MTKQNLLNGFLQAAVVLALEAVAVTMLFYKIGLIYG